MQAAYFALLRYKPNTEITTETRRAVLASARKLGLMSAAPHDLHGWARLLIQEHKTKGQPYQMAIANEVHDRAAVLYSLWRPSLRYRIVLPKTKEMEVAQDCAKWFNDHGAEL